MRLCTIKTERPQAAVVTNEGLLPVALINDVSGGDFPTDLLGIVRDGDVTELGRAVADYGDRIAPLPVATTPVGPPYRNPPKVWGFGPNYGGHARDLEVNVREEIPDAPGSYMKPNDTIIGPGDTIQLPPESKRVTAEAELAVIVGREGRNLNRTEARAAIFGYTAVLDMTAEDLLRRNLRYIARAKCHDTFFSFGPVIVTADELTDVSGLMIATVVNGVTAASGRVSGMTYSPDWLLSYHSQMTRLEPGDVIATGTPGASVITDGDRVEGMVEGIGTLVNDVRAAGTP
jgi:2-keto-4-pentenoate hydratase/2-oxohepta-3-ene-1,7-dioic acid hydratase in catechol pathway